MILLSPCSFGFISTRFQWVSVSSVFSQYVDLPQVDLMNFRVEYVRPDVLQRSGRCLRRVATERATKPREVDLSRLKGFHLRFAPKMRGCMTCNWPDDIWKLNGGKCRFHSNQNNRMCVCFSCVERAN